MLTTTYVRILRDILDPANIVNHIGINIVQVIIFLHIYCTSLHYNNYILQFLGTQVLWLVLFLLSSAASTRKRRSLEDNELLLEVKELLTLEEKELLLEDNDVRLKEKELLLEENNLLLEEKELQPEENELLLEEKELLATATAATKKLVLATASGKTFFRKQGLGRKGGMSSE